MIGCGMYEQKLMKANMFDDCERRVNYSERMKPLNVFSGFDEDISKERVKLLGKVSHKAAFVD